MEAVPKRKTIMRKTFTLEQIAKLAGVSRTTASRVINGLPGVRATTRERVLKVIEEYGYHPDPTAQSLAALRSRKGS
jgi:LacI family transcriptional regulator